MVVEYDLLLYFIPIVWLNTNEFLWSVFPKIKVVLTNHKNSFVWLLSKEHLKGFEHKAVTKIFQCQRINYWNGQEYITENYVIHIIALVLLWQQLTGEIENAQNILTDNCYCRNEM